MASVRKDSVRSPHQCEAANLVTSSLYRASQLRKRFAKLGGRTADDSLEHRHHAPDLDCPSVYAPPRSPYVNSKVSPKAAPTPSSRSVHVEPLSGAEVGVVN